MFSTWCAEKLKEFVTGVEVVFETDHKPLANSTDKEHKRFTSQLSTRKDFFSNQPNSKLVNLNLYLPYQNDQRWDQLVAPLC